MKRRTFLSAGALATVGAAVAIPGNAFASGVRSLAPGEIRQDQWMSSDILGADVTFMLYLPAGYDPAQNYPVLYLLHGTGGTGNGWLGDGNAIESLDAAIEAGRMPPTVTVFADGRPDPALPPDAQDLTYWMNDAAGEFRYADMLVEELMPFIASEHNAGGGKETSAIGGISMGGWGALSFAMRYPDTFAAAFSLSSGQRTEQQLIDLDMDGYNWRYGRAWGRDLAGEARLNELYREWNLPDVIDRTETDILAGTGYWLDCGEQDEFLPGNEWLRGVLTDNEVPHEYSTRPGGHDWGVWGEAFPLALEWTGGHFAA